MTGGSVHKTTRGIVATAVGGVGSCFFLVIALHGWDSLVPQIYRASIPGVRTFVGIAEPVIFCFGGIVLGIISRLIAPNMIKLQMILAAVIAFCIVLPRTITFEGVFVFMGLLIPLFLAFTCVGGVWLGRKVGAGRASHDV